uniref:Uncharacterized protein n=1 Tax=viral metagenome TaxID=1070528 RepID=A0A6C0J2L6_9ZZZZ
MFSGKFKHVALYGLLFFILSHPIVYGLTNSVLGPLVAPTISGGAPTTYGLVVHSVVFAAVAYLLHKHA